MLIPSIDLQNGSAVQLVGGKDKLMVFFVGQAMKGSAGKADPKAVSRLFQEALARAKG